MNSYHWEPGKSSSRRSGNISFWLEIAYKLLEKDERRTKINSRIIEPYNRLKAAYTQRVEGSGDFAIRLSDLTARILERYEAAIKANHNETAVSAKTLEIVYGSEIRAMREEVLRYLKLKGIVCFLFDNLDRFWTPTGFAEADALIIIGLAECLQDIRKRFTRAERRFPMGNLSPKRRL